MSGCFRRDLRWSGLQYPKLYHPKLDVDYSIMKNE